MAPEKRTTSATGGQKGTKLARFDLIPQGPLTEVAEHFGMGALKYANHQWRQGYEWSKSFAAKQRHDSAFWAGFDYDVCSNDPDGCSFVTAEGEEFVPIKPDTCYNHTGSHHMAASAWHALVLLEFKDRYPLFDDRYHPGQDDENYQEHFWAELYHPTEEQLAERARVQRNLSYVDPKNVEPEEPLHSDGLREPVISGGHLDGDSFDPFEAVDISPYREETETWIRELAELMPEPLTAEVLWKDPEPITAESVAINLEALRSAFDLPYIRFISQLVEGRTEHTDRGPDNWERYAEDSTPNYGFRVRYVLGVDPREVGPDLLSKHRPRTDLWTLPYEGQAKSIPIPTEDWSLPSIDVVGGDD